MSDEDFDGNESEGVRSLREALKKAQQEKDAQAKLLADLVAKDRTRSIADKFSEFKINPKIAKMVPATVEIEKIDEWIGENADWLGVNLTDNSSDNAEEAASQSRISGLGITSPLVDDQPDMTAIKAATSGADLDRIIYARLSGTG